MMMMMINWPRKRRTRLTRIRNVSGTFSVGFFILFSESELQLLSICWLFLLSVICTASCCMRMHCNLF
jgi:hypothetical protein